LRRAAEGGTEGIDSLCPILGIKVAELRAGVETAVGDLASELVMIGMENSISRSFTKNWLTTQGCNEKFVYFVDAVSLLALIQESNYSAVELVSFEGKLESSRVDCKELQKDR
jgi:hypothetical protein